MPKFTLEEHLTIADHLAIAAHHLDEALTICRKGYPDSSRLIKKLCKLQYNFLGGAFGSVKVILDDDYLQAIKNSDFRKYGYVYHNLISRYKLLQEKND